MIITRKSPISGNVNSMDLAIIQEQLDRYVKNDELIQDIFPNLTPREREFLLTGITAEEWDATFKDDE